MAKETKTAWQRRIQAKSQEIKLTHEAAQLLEGETIMEVRYMSEKEATSMGWSTRPLIMKLSSGRLLIPQCDDEGNDGGSLMHYIDGVDDVIPSL